MTLLDLDAAITIILHHRPPPITAPVVSV